jgi:hypothetical protein
MSSSPLPAAKPRILLIARACNVAGMIDELHLRATDTYYCYDHKRPDIPSGMKPFTLGAIWKIRRAICENKYDLVVTCSYPDSLWRKDRNWISNAVKFVKKFKDNPGALASHLLPWILADSKVPLAVFDWDDITIIPRKNWGLLNRATCYFKTQTPCNPFKAFLFQDKRNDDIFNIVKQPVYQEWAKKLRPICIGITLPKNWFDLQDTEKKTDVFFAGSVHYSWARIEGLRQLEQMRAEGFAIDLHLPGPGVPLLPPDEFLRRCSQAWLVWSPEGAGWDCMRHYWAPMMNSVPLLNQPDTRRHMPLIDGEHAYYYGVEDSDLKRVVRLALSDKDRLRQMARDGQAFVRSHHLHAPLVEHLIAETLKSAAA